MDTYGLVNPWTDFINLTFSPDPTDPLEGFDTFFTTGEYFKHVEVGWITSPDRPYEDNIQVLVDPALNPDADVIGVFGLRARIAF